MKAAILLIYNLIIFLIIFFYFSNTAYGQTNFKAGKIVTLSGDTIHGMIDDQNTLSNPTFISFKAQDEKVLYNFKPTEIKASIVDSGDYYLSAILEIDMNYGQRIDIGNTISNDTVLKIDTVFLRVLLQSKMSLYLYNDKNIKNHFYYKNDSSNYHELTFKKIPVTIDGIVYLKNSTRYKNQLRFLMGDSPEVLSKINKTEYTEGDLLKLFEEYNKSFNNNPISTFGSLKNANHSSFYLIMGLDITNLNIYTTPEDFEKNVFSTSYRPTLGMAINIPLKRSLNKYSLLMELNWKKIGTKSNYIINYYEYNLIYNLDYLKFNIGFKYKIPGIHLKPYFHAGPLITYLISSNFQRNTYNQNPNLLPQYSRETSEEGYIHPKKLGFGFFGGIGFNYNKFGFEIRYEKLSGFLDGQGMAIDSFYFLVLFQLNKSE